MKMIPYACIVENLMYAQTCIRTEYMFTFKKSDHLKVIDYSDSDFARCVDSRKSTFGYCSYYLEERYHEKVQNKLSLFHLLWKLNLWHALRPQFKDCGCEILSQDLELSTLLPSR